MVPRAVRTIRNNTKHQFQSPYLRWKELLRKYLRQRRADASHLQIESQGSSTKGWRQAAYFHERDESSLNSLLHTFNSSSAPNDSHAGKVHLRPPSNCVYHTRTNFRHTDSCNGGNTDTIGQDLQQTVLRCGPPRKRLLQTAHKHVVQRRRNESTIDGHGTGSRGNFGSGKRCFEIILRCPQLCDWPL